MSSLADPVFATPDAKQAEADLQAQYAALTGKSLFPAQPEALMGNWMAYLKTIVDAAIQYTGEQNLVNFAVGANLDQVGALFGSYGERLPASAALCTLRFTLIAAEALPKVIPAGTRVRTSDGLHLFATKGVGTIAVGDTAIDLEAEATETGADANGYPVGEVNDPFDLISNLASAENITATNSGADAESDDRYRERLKLAPNALTVAGTTDSYKFWALTADPTITAVAVRSPSPAEQVAARASVAEEAAQLLLDEIVNNRGGTAGTATAANLGPLIEGYISVRYFYVEIYPLVATGLPSPEVLTKVTNTLSAADVRPLNDEVRVLSPVNVNYTVSATCTAYASADLTALQAALDAAAQSLADELAQSLGRNIVPSQFVDALSLAGVYNVVVSSPAAVTEVDYNERANATSITVTIAGVVDDAE